MFAITALTMSAYGLIHSCLASTSLKQFIRQLVGEQRYYGLYRASYNFFAIVSLSPILGLIILRPGNILWQVSGLGQLLFMLIQGIGIIGITLSLYQINLGQFIGISQMMAYFRGQTLPLPPESLQFGGVYHLVRHPLYLFSLLVIWPMGVMSESLLAFNIASTLYFVVGSILEERRLAATYGEPYRTYQKSTPSIIPFLKGFR